VPQTKNEIRDLLGGIQASPQHRLGQNFMIDGNLVRVVAAAGELSQDDAVIEVGPGTGTLTGELLAAARRVLAVEIDRKLAEMLSARYADDARIEILNADALAGKHQLNSRVIQWIDHARREGLAVKLVSNLPYAIASPLVVELLIAGVDLLAFTVQKEVAQRLRSAADGELYGPLSIMVQLLADVEQLRTMPPQAFWPMPKVDSALVRMRRRDRLGAEAERFSRFVHAVFSSRRKTLKKAMELAGVADAERAIGAVGLDGQVRPQNLRVEQWCDLFAAVGERPRGGEGPAG
jgi:16S rRNA (adenine1518-N6/adenine1519-N6)-dimethyltransferase